jgi:ribulose-phosphate 3-epimerase
LIPHLGKVDQVIVMTVNPGFAGQKFNEDIVERIEFLKLMKKNHPELKFEISVDGGVNLENAARCIQAGADILVSASALFDKNRTMKEVVQKMRGAR